MTEKDNIKKEIEEARKRLQLLEEREKLSTKNTIIKQLEEYTIEEKVKWFNKMYKNAEEELIELETKGYSDEDNEHYCWENYIEVLAKNNKKFWNYWNSFN